MPRGECLEKGEKAWMEPWGISIDEPSRRKEILGNCKETVKGTKKGQDIIINNNVGEIIAP